MFLCRLPSLSPHLSLHQPSNTHHHPSEPRGNSWDKEWGGGGRQRQTDSLLLWTVCGSYSACDSKRMDLIWLIYCSSIQTSRHNAWQKSFFHWNFVAACHVTAVNFYVFRILCDTDQHMVEHGFYKLKSEKSGFHLYSALLKRRFLKPHLAAVFGDR